MNTRCYRCGRSFTSGREALEAAAVSSVGQKFHVVYCPNCRMAIKIPMVQVMRELPAGWKPPAPEAAEAQPAAVEAAAPEPAAEPESGPEPKSSHHHRRSSAAKVLGGEAEPATGAAGVTSSAPAMVASKARPLAKPAEAQPEREAGSDPGQASTAATTRSGKRKTSPAAEDAAPAKTAPATE